MDNLNISTGDLEDHLCNVIYCCFFSSPNIHHRWTVITRCKQHGIYHILHVDKVSELLAIPNYARANRFEGAGDEVQSFGGTEGGGPGSRSRGITSRVWIKEGRE